MLCETAAVLVSFATFFTFQFATTCAFALGFARTFARTTYPRLGVSLFVLGHGSERRAIRDGFRLRGGIVAARGEGSAVAGHAGGHGGYHAQIRSPELCRRLGGSSLGLEGCARHALGGGSYGGNVAGSGGAHALAAGDAVCRVHGGGYGVRVRTGFGQRASHGARMAVLA